MAEPSDLEAENAYFASNPPPRDLALHTSRAQSFIAHHAAHPSRRVVLVTSGGTTVPLEKQTVRFIDNFSAGTRGATSAEYFLREGYAVIFLHRQFSLLPFARHYSHSPTDCLLDFLSLPDERAGAAQHTQDRRRRRSSNNNNDTDNDNENKEETTRNTGDLLVRVRSDEAKRMASVLRRYRAAKDTNQLLILPFLTIGDYLHSLRALAHAMQPLGPRGLLYLAAAVSDFFVPPERMSEHKIQSTDMAHLFSPPDRALRTDSRRGSAGPFTAQQAREQDEEFDNFDAYPAAPRHKQLIVNLDPVPKFLKNLVDGWAPQGMIASYKLETDPALLVLKARLSLERYQHHLVIGNLLATRKHEVVFVSPGREDDWVRLQPRGEQQQQQQTQKEKDDDDYDDDEEIEGLIIPKVAELHAEHIARGNKSA